MRIIFLLPLAAALVGTASPCGQTLRLAPISLPFAETKKQCMSFSCDEYESAPSKQMFRSVAIPAQTSRSEVRKNAERRNKTRKQQEGKQHGSKLINANSGYP
ncbi:hypothetical protein E2F50_15755 [Rhizobium deserti]|uniref:Secreted protein n=1 Tax=Rhizobium deserti TaxID=2547961 RepID=A0A4R5UFL0_9HYPH|nr:hypothetical protein [Rhizobium deserti]TDK34299.1 hypothetical protein E2F50_15755 [Rhizobium deserti]